jgi:RimJ/RimL family protein N-acetyltransferase
MTDPIQPPIRPLRGEHVYLRPAEPTDAELVHRWYEDARVLALMGELPRSLARRQRSFDLIDSGGDSGGVEYFAFIICRLCDDERIGRTDVFDIDRHNGSAAFGITIGDPALWGRGLGTDAVNAVVDFAFGQLRLERLWLGTDARNTRAHAAYAKAGFTVEGRLRHAYFQDGEFVDEIRMAMLREEWAALPRPRSWQLVEQVVWAAGAVAQQ